MLGELFVFIVKIVGVPFNTIFCVRLEDSFFLQQFLIFSPSLNPFFRFHSLAEFDEGKRSCRKRLDGHNRRRRKPQPELSRNSGLLFSSPQGFVLLEIVSLCILFPFPVPVNDGGRLGGRKYS